MENPLFCIVQLVRSGGNASDVVKIYTSIIRSVLGYSCQVWHPGLTSQQSNDIEMIQKRCLKFPFRQKFWTVHRTSWQATTYRPSYFP